METPVSMSVRMAEPIPGNGVLWLMRQLRYRVEFLPRLLMREFVVCALAAAVLAPALPAQQSGSASSTTPGWPLHSSAPDHALPDATGPQPVTAPPLDRDESCLLWAVTAAGPAPTVKAAALEVPGKARAEYKKGCSELRGKKLDSAETHLRKAVEEYPKYSVAWVLLGQVLEAGNHMEEARGACAKASGADAEYAPAYLCLADVAGQLHQWDQMQELADRALKLDAPQSVYGHFYCAMAQFHLNQLAAAERNAQDSIDADHLHHLPQAHLLLAQIYGTKHDLHHAAEQLQAYLAAAPNAPDAGEVKKKLAALESQPAQ